MDSVSHLNKNFKKISFQFIFISLGQRESWGSVHETNGTGGCVRSLELFCDIFNKILFLKQLIDICLI